MSLSWYYHSQAHTHWTERRAGILGRELIDTDDSNCERECTTRRADLSQRYCELETQKSSVNSNLAERKIGLVSAQKRRHMAESFYDNRSVGHTHRIVARSRARRSPRTSDKYKAWVDPQSPRL